MKIKLKLKTNKLEQPPFKPSKPVRPTVPWPGTPPELEASTLSATQRNIDRLQKKLADKNKGITNPYDRMKKIHANWVRLVNIHLKDRNDLLTNTEKDTDRIDITPYDNNKWRICLVGMIDQTMAVTILYRSKPDMMDPQISFSHVPTSSVISILDDCLKLKDKYLEFSYSTGKEK